jgi:hypothetical protein
MFQDTIAHLTSKLCCEASCWMYEFTICFCYLACFYCYVCVSKRLVGGICGLEGGVTYCLVKVCRWRSAGQAGGSRWYGGWSKQWTGGRRSQKYFSFLAFHLYFNFDTHLSLLVAFSFLLVEFAFFFCLVILFQFFLPCKRPLKSWKLTNPKFY